MDADIFLTGARVFVNGDELHVRAHDLYVDNPDRRSNQKGGRRAVVHDQHDGLTINFNHDYPGGVTIFGPVTIKGELHVETPDGKVVPFDPQALQDNGRLVSHIGALEERLTTLERLSRTPGQV